MFLKWAKLLFLSGWYMGGTLILTLYGIIVWIAPELAFTLSLEGLVDYTSKPEHLIIVGLILWILTVSIRATIKIDELESEIVEVDAGISRDTESYFGKDIVYLLVYNHENFDLKDCYANLTVLESKYMFGEDEKIFNKKDHLWQNMLLIINLNRNKLSWPSFGVGVEKYITPSKPERIDFARIEKDEIVFLFENENNSLTVTGEYYVEIEVGGYINGKQIRKIKFEGRLFFRHLHGKYRISLQPMGALNEGLGRL